MSAMLTGHESARPVVVVSLAALGCVKPVPPHAPPAYEGTVPLTIVNGTPNLLCQYLMMGVGKGKPQHDNWLGSTVLDARKQESAQLAPSRGHPAPVAAAAPASARRTRR